MNIKEIEDEIVDINIQHTNIRNQLIRIEGVLIYLEHKKLLLLQEENIKKVQKKPKPKPKSKAKVIKG